MKRTLLASSLAIVLAIPAFAGARAIAPNVYLGEVEAEPGASVKLRTEVDNNDRNYVSKFVVRDFFVDCEGGVEQEMRKALLQGKILIGERRRFHDRDDNGETVFNLRGRVGSRKATGTFRFSGDIETSDGAIRDCDSGRQEWIAD